MRKLITTVAATLFLLSGATIAAASPGGEGCAPGYTTWDVSAEPYQADNLVDEEGNNNGVVCARAIGKPHPSGGQMYQFRDDDMIATR